MIETAQLSLILAKHSSRVLLPLKLLARELLTICGKPGMKYRGVLLHPSVGMVTVEAFKRLEEAFEAGCHLATVEVSQKINDNCDSHDLSGCARSLPLKVES